MSRDAPPAPPAGMVPLTSIMREQFPIGRLGATFVGSIDNAQRAQLDMVERRILRIEMLLRRAGIEPESIPLGSIG